MRRLYSWLRWRFVRHYYKLPARRIYPGLLPLEPALPLTPPSGTIFTLKANYRGFISTHKT